MSITQNTLIKNIQTAMPKTGETDRQNSREQIVDSLVRETNMSKSRIQDLTKLVLAMQEQQSNQRMNNDECSSGGTNPTAFNYLENEVMTLVQVSIWLEEAIACHIGDFKTANYKTLIRRVNQNIRTKEDFKLAVIKARSQDDASALIENFVSGRGPASKHQNDNSAVE